MDNMTWTWTLSLTSAALSEVSRYLGGARVPSVLVASLSLVSLLLATGAQAISFRRSGCLSCWGGEGRRRISSGRSGRLP